jgi:hypothetical protein
MVSCLFLCAYLLRVGLSSGVHEILHEVVVFLFYSEGIVRVL